MKYSFYLFIFICLFQVTAFTESNQETIPVYDKSSLEILKSFMGDQEKFEKKIRAFEKLYLAIARAKYLEARKYEETKESEKAKSASDEAHQLLMMIQEAYELGLQKFDKSAVLNNYYGELAHDYLGRPNEAAKYWLNAVQCDEKYGRAHSNLGMYYFHTGMYGMGLEHLDKALSLEPDNPDYLFNMVQVYLTNFLQIMQIRKWDRSKIYLEAMKISARAVSLGPKDYELLRDYAQNHNLARNFGVETDWRAAVRAWEEAGKYARNDAERFNCLLNVGRAWLRSGEKKKAKQCFNKADEMMPGNPVVQTLLEETAK
jgi:tetratricopeptide (TPR) repeat protein